MSRWLPLVIFLLLRLGFWLMTFPNPDEAYYWLWGQHPGLSYYDHPPFLAWMQGIFTALLGRSPFSLRLPNLISNGALFFIYYRITQYLYGENGKAAFWLVVLLVLSSPLYFLFLALAWNDHLLITWAIAAAFLFITFLDDFIKTRRGASWRLYGAAVCLGVAGLCKYNAVFVALGFVATLVADRRLRPLLRDWRLYGAGAIVLGVLAPIGLWNIANQFQSFRYYADRSVNAGSFSLHWGSSLGFLVLCALTVSPVFCIALYRVGQQRSALCVDSVYRSVAFWIFGLSTGILTLVSLISAALYYWNIVAYLLLFPLLPAVFLAPTSPTKTSQRLFFRGQVYGLVFATLLVIHYSILPLSALVSNDADPDSRMLVGWEAVASEVRSQAQQIHHPLLLTTDYRSAAALAYQLNDKTVIALSDRIDQFDFWYRNLAQFRGRDAVILSDDWHPLQLELANRFDRLSAPLTIPVTRFGIWIKNYYLHKGYGFKGSNIN